MFRDLARLPHPVRALSLAGIPLLIVGLVGAPAQAAEAPVGLGTAGSFAVLAGQSVTNTGPSIVTGDIGVGLGTSVTGIPPLVQLDGALHVADAVANQAQADLTTAYNSAAGRSTVTDVTGSDLGGLTLTSGVVEHTSAMQLTGTLTLDAQGDPSAVFIFKAGSTLITAPNSTVSLINGASPCNVYWQVGSSTTLDTNTTFVGTVMSLTSATLNTGASLQGRMLARNGSVTLDTNVITRPDCAAPAPTTSTSPTVSPSATPTTSALSSAPLASPSSSANGGNSSSSPSTSGSNNGQGGNNNGSGANGSNDNGTNDNGSGTNGSGGGGGSSEVTGGSSSTPVVPVGHPETGLGGVSEPGVSEPGVSESDGPGWGLISLLAGTGLAAVVLGWRRSRPFRLG